MMNCSLPLSLYGGSRANTGVASGKRTQKRKKNNPNRVPRIDGVKPLSVFRKCTYQGSVSTSAAGIILNQSITTANISTFCTEFSSLANLFGEYRCHSLAVKAIPNQTTSTGAPLGYQQALLISKFESGVIPTSSNSILSSESFKCFSTLEPWKYETNVKGFLDGKLWTATTAVIPAVNSFGISYIGANNATMAVSSRVFDLFIEFMVEFRMQF
jgi:hypothetical protein